MNSTVQQKKKRIVMLATLHVFLWVWLSSALEKRFSAHSPVTLLAGIGFIVALWLGYRAVLALRRIQKSHEA